MNQLARGLAIQHLAQFLILLDEMDSLQVCRITRGDAGYPSRVESVLGSNAPDFLEFLGPNRMPAAVHLGLVCSVSCPGSVIIQTYDVIRALRDARVVVAGGFHSPMELECLDFLLRGVQPVVLCAATGLPHLTLTPELARALADRRLSVLSPFGADVVRATSAEGVRRNEIVSAIADAVFVPHATPGGRAEQCASNAIARGQRVMTFADPANEPLVKTGALPVTIARLVTLCVQPPIRTD